MKQDKSKIFTINGRQYDAETGLLIGSVSQVKIADSKERLRQPAQASSGIHRGLQRSQTLRRSAVAQPKLTTSQAQAKLPTTPREAQRSPMIRRFADISPPTKQRSSAVQEPITPTDRPFKVHPVAERAIQRQASERATSPQPALQNPSASTLKQALINEAMNQASTTNQYRRPARADRRKKQSKKPFRLASLATASLVVALLGGYFSYLAMPNLSVRVAAIQSGVDASYPGYRPVGYRLNGPVAYSGGQVSMKFQANSGSHSFVLTQSNSNWDSTAVELNYIQPDVGDEYSVTKKQGLTIYTYGNGKAAWVNKGVFYSLNGNAPITSDQIARLATSM